MTASFNDLAAALPQLERELAEVEGRARALREIVVGIRALQGDGSALLDPAYRHKVHGNTRAAFLGVMDEYPQRIWKLTEIRKRLLAAGAAPSTKAIDAMAKRLRQEGTIVQPRYGFYMLPRAES